MGIILDTIMGILTSGTPGVVVDKTVTTTGGMVARHFSEKALQEKVESQLNNYYQDVQNTMDSDEEFDNIGLLNGSKDLISSAKACSVGPEREMRRRQYFALGYSLAGQDSKQKNQTLDAILASVLNFVQEESGDAITIKAVDELHDHMNRLATKEDIKSLGNQINALSASDTIDFSDYYSFIVEEFTEEKDNNSVELLGNESDDKAYIEQFITVEFGRKSALPFLNDWFSERKYGTLLICGEPGHGKSLLCKKAVVEYKRGHFLNGKAQNVLAISLNTGENPGIIMGKEVSFENMLAWGPIREHRFCFEDCRGSLLFLDGFDEFIDEAKKANVKDIVSFMNRVDKIAKAYSMHVVVLSRSIAVQKEIHDPEINNKTFTLSPITKKQQRDWLKERNDYSDYTETLLKLQGDKDMGVLLGIPLLFRMIVHTRYKRVSSNIVELYDGLFEHLMRERSIYGAVLRKVRKELSDHAYKVYCNDEDTAEVEKQKRDENWLLTFYVKSVEGGRIGFFHRSFYQYFLARYILSHILNVETDKQAEDFIGLFAERQLDDTVRYYLSQTINKDNGEIIHNNLKMIIDALVRTEAYLNLEPKYLSGTAEKSKLGRTINVYQNTLHICVAFSYVIEKPFKDGIDVFIRTYPSNSITICSAEDNRTDLSKANLSGALLSGAQLIDADLSETNLSRADLSGAYLSGAHLSGANLSGANLSKANLIDAKLISADLSNANLSEANLIKADLNEANLIDALLSNANLIDAKLIGADLSNANLSEANLIRAKLNGADLRRANLNKIRLSEANLIGAFLIDANLSEARLRNADMRKTKLFRANLIGANLSEACLSKANLSGANLIGAHLIGAKLIGADLSGVNLGGAFLSKANLSKANLSGANLSEANLIVTNLSEVNLSGANLVGANLIGANLIGADISGADLRVRCIKSAIIESNKKDLIDPNINGYKTIVWVDSATGD